MNEKYSSILPKSFYSRHPLPVAKDLLGKLLVRRVDERTIMSGLIIDTEAYGPPSEDPLVKTEGTRGLRMDWEPGYAWTTYLLRGRPSLNITTMKPSCVLIRSIKLLQGRQIALSATKPILGPISLTKSLKIDTSLDKVDVTETGPLFICKACIIFPNEIVESRRKNVKKDTKEHRRFFLKRICVRCIGE